MKIESYIVGPQENIRSVINVINQNKDGIALVVDETGKLVGTVTDGDIRRFMLSGRSIDGTCQEVMNSNPVCAKLGAVRETLVTLIRRYRIRNIPLVTDSGHPVDLFSFNELIDGKGVDTIGVIMAGGQGTRLRPLTDTVPKPMLEVGEGPLLMQIIDKLKGSGISDIYISVNYGADIIERYFGDGSNFDVRIRYLKEKKPLGTAGALSLLDRSMTAPVLVVNGDVVTNINFERFLEFHRQHRSAMSVAAMDYHLNIPYGVLDLAGHFVIGLEEKPDRRFLCNAGIYALDPEAVNLVPEDTYYDMTDLLKTVINRGYPVAAFPIHEYWIDIGNKNDLKRAKADFFNRNGKERQPEE